MNIVLYCEGCVECSGVGVKKCERKVENETPSTIGRAVRSFALYGEKSYYLRRLSLLIDTSIALSLIFVLFFTISTSSS